MRGDGSCTPGRAWAHVEHVARTPPEGVVDWPEAGLVPFVHHPRSNTVRLRRIDNGARASGCGWRYTARAPLTASSP
jgi:hypothetical protein